MMMNSRIEEHALHTIGHVNNINNELANSLNSNNSEEEYDELLANEYRKIRALQRVYDRSCRAVCCFGCTSPNVSIGIFWYLCCLSLTSKILFINFFNYFFILDLIPIQLKI